jgi:putative transposase
MKKKRFTEEQMVTILREADARPVPEVAKKHGVSAPTIYTWRKHFGSLEAADVKRLRHLEQENGQAACKNSICATSTCGISPSAERKTDRKRAQAMRRCARCPLVLHPDALSVGRVECGLVEGREHALHPVVRGVGAPRPAKLRVNVAALQVEVRQNERRLHLDLAD